SDRSARTLKSRKDILHHLVWFLKRRQFADCGLPELRAFFLYLQKAHLEPGGRWDNPTETRPLKPGTIKTYYGLLRSFFNFGVTEGRIATSPLTRVTPPVDRADEVQPFTESQVTALLAAARKSQHPLRDEAILLTLLDTGLRASECCDIRYTDVDFTNRQM